MCVCACASGLFSITLINERAGGGEGRRHTTVIKETQIVRNETKYQADEKKMEAVGS